MFPLEKIARGFCPLHQVDAVLLSTEAAHSKEILEAHDGEVKRKLVAEAFDYSVAFHAHEVTA